MDGCDSQRKDRRETCNDIRREHNRGLAHGDRQPRGDRIDLGVAAQLSVGDATRSCLWATIGDMIIMLMAYAVVAIGWRDRRWMVTASGAQLVLFIAIGVWVTVLI